MSNKVILEAIEGSHAGQNFIFDENGTYLIGRSKYSALKISNAKDMKISRIHMLLILDSHYVRVRDLGSRNGTTVNGIELLPTELTEHPEKMNPLDKVLKSGDIISIGDSVWKVEIISKEDFDENATMPIEKLESNKEKLNIKKTLPQISTNSEKSLLNPIQINKKPLTLLKANPQGAITQVKSIELPQQNAPIEKALPEKVRKETKKSLEPNVTTLPKDSKLQLLEKSTKKAKVKEKEAKQKLEKIKDSKSDTIVMEPEEFDNLDDLVYKIEPTNKKRKTNFTIKQAK